MTIRDRHDRLRTLGGGTAALDGTATRCATSVACITRRIAEFFEALESDDERRAPGRIESGGHGAAEVFPPVPAPPVARG